MAVNLSPIGGVAGQFFDNNGDPLVGGKLYTYAAGTTTPQVTYTTSSGTTPNSNPIILNGGGRVPSEIWLTDGVAYKFVLYSSTDQLIGSWDNISGINSNFVNYTASQEIQTATSGQTVFTLTTMEYQPGTNSLTVYVDGVNQYGPGALYAYVETNSTTVTFNSGLHVGAEVKFTTVQQATSLATDAAQVAYQPAGTGAVTTNVQAKLRETVSVKDFGAVGDGVTDDTVAIQAAANDLTNGGVLLFPSGTYTLAGVTIPDGVLLSGYGATVSVASGQRCFTIGSNVTIEGLDFDGNDNGSANTTNFFIYALEKSNIVVRDCSFTDMSNNALVFDGSSDVAVSNCRFSNIRQASGITGISVATSSNLIPAKNLAFRKCSFVNADLLGDGAAAFILVGDQINDVQIDNVIIDGCYFEKMGRKELAVGPRGDIDVYHDVLNLTVTNCISKDSGHSFYKGNDIQGLYIANNQIYNSTRQAIVNSIRYGNTRNDKIIVTSNAIYNSLSRGIDLRGSATDLNLFALQTSVTNNFVDGCPADSINIRNCIELSVSGNQTINQTAGSFNITCFNNIASTASQFSVQGNIVDGGGTAIGGIQVQPQNTGATVVSGNLVRNTTGNGFVIQDTPGAIVSGNQTVSVTTPYNITGGDVRLNFNSSGTQSATISGGVVTLAAITRRLVVDTEGGAATDDLDSIVGGFAGDMVVIQTANNGRDVTVKDGTGNIQLSGDFLLDRTLDTITLIYDGTAWCEVARNNNA